MNLEAHIETVAKGLAREPDKVSLGALWKGQGRVLRIKCAATDYGRLVGRKSWAIKALNILAMERDELVTVVIERNGPPMNSESVFDPVNEDRSDELKALLESALWLFDPDAKLILRNSGKELWAEVDSKNKEHECISSLSCLFRAVAMNHGKEMVLTFTLSA